MNVLNTQAAFDQNQRAFFKGRTLQGERPHTMECGCCWRSIIPAQGYHCRSLSGEWSWPKHFHHGKRWCLLKIEQCSILLFHKCSPCYMQQDPDNPHSPEGTEAFHPVSFSDNLPLTASLPLDSYCAPCWGQGSGNLCQPWRLSKRQVGKVNL